MDTAKDARHVVDGTYSSQATAVNKGEQKLEVANMAVTNRLNHIVVVHIHSSLAASPSFRVRATGGGDCFSKDTFQSLARTNIALNFVLIRV